jgi:hypothetical protein
MEVNLVQKEEFEALVARIDNIQHLLKKILSIEVKKDWIDNNEFCRALCISKRTAQTYRDRKLISYSQVGSKILYKSSDVEAFLQQHHIKSIS